MNKITNNFILNCILLVCGIATIFSGVLIQAGYHMGHHGTIDASRSVFGLDYGNWSDIHKLSIVLFSVLMGWHITRHLKWYRAVIDKKRVPKRGMVLILSFCFLLVAVTGVIPWCIDVFNGNAVLRKILIEIHDKLTLIFMACIVWHIAGRINSFIRRK
jgi:hypothetical protein